MTLRDSDHRALLRVGAVCLALALLFGVLSTLSCRHGSSGSDSQSICAYMHCTETVARPLSAEETRNWQERANAYVDAEIAAGRLSPNFGGPHVYPLVEWAPCPFPVRGECAAGLTVPKSNPKRIKVSTFQPARTGPLVAHETTHARYCKADLSCDAAHRLRYGW